MKQTDKREYYVSVRERPIKGAANLAVLKVLAKELGVPKSLLRVVSGHKSGLKIIEVIE